MQFFKSTSKALRNQRPVCPSMSQLQAISREAETYGNTLLAGIAAVNELLSLASETVSPLDRKLINNVGALMSAVGDLALGLHDVGNEAAMLLEGGVQ